MNDIIKIDEMLERGFSISDIANSLGFSRNTINKINKTVLKDF